MRRTTLYVILLAALVLGAFGPPAAALMPSSGNVTAVVIGGYAYNGGYGETAKYYRDMLFEQGYTSNNPRGSLRDFYREASYYDFYAADAALPTPLYSRQGLDVAGDASMWYMHANVADDDDPDQNSVNWFNGTDIGNQPREDDFLQKTISASRLSMFNPMGIDYTDPKYDIDNDGVIDCIIVYFPSDLNMSPTGAHCYFNYGYTVMGHTVGALIVARQDQGVQTICHEMGHAQGLPDLYDYGGTDPSSSGVGIYDLMCYQWDGAHPGPTGKTSLDYLEPIEVRIVGGLLRVSHSVLFPTPLTGNTVEVTLRPYAIYPDLIRWPATQAGGAFNPNSDESFFLFNRRQIGFESRLPGQGIQIWHVDPNVGSNEYEWWPEISDATETPHLFAACEQADGLWEIERGINSGDAEDFFGLTASTRKFTSETRPSSRGYGQTRSLVNVVDMEEDGNDFRVTFSLPTRNITGNIALGGVGLAGVKVTATSVGLTEPLEAYTGPSGNFAFAGVFAGSYTLTPELSGYSFTPATRTAVVTNADVPNQNFVATQRTFTINVHTTDGSADLPGVTVSVPGAPTAPAVTDAGGLTSATGLTAGSYFVVPSLSGYVFTPSQALVTFPLPSDPAADHIDLPVFVASAISSISGRVTDSVSGIGIEGGVVTASPSGDTATTRADGTYTLPFIPAGVAQTVSVTKDEYTFSADQVVTTPPSATNINFTGARNTYSVSGVVTTNGAPLAGVTVSVGGRTATTSGAGTYTVTGLYQGTYTATASLAPYTMTPASRSVTVGPNATGVNFAADAPAVGAFSVGGRVTLNGAGLPGVLVSNGTAQVYTNASGDYLFTNLTAGAYTFTPTLADHSFTPGSASVTVGPSVADLDFAATSTSVVTYSIAGLITVNGAPLPGVEVSVGSTTATTGANGAYRVTGLAPGAYVVRPTLANYAFAPSTRSVTISSADVSGINFTGTLLVYSISGRILDGSTWSGLAGVLVSVGSRVTTTNATGDFTLGGLSGGAYTPTLTLAGYSFTPTPTAVTVGPSVGGLSFTGYQVFRRTFAAGWQLFSLPCIPNDNTLEGIFGTAPTVYAWDPVARTYNSISDPLEQGSGYWANLPGVTNVVIGGQALTEDQFMLPLIQGWQLLGNPFSTPIDWSRTQVAKDGVAVTLTQAAANGWLLPYAWTYTGRTPSLIHDFIPGASPVVQPWQGFFVYAGASVSIILHAEDGAAVSSRSVATKGGFSIPVTAECAGVEDAGHIMGVAPASQVGAEGLGIAAPPSLQKDLALRFTRTGSPETYGVDIRADGGRSWTWNLQVTSALAHQPVTLTFGDMRSLPREYEILLVDKTAGKSLSLRTNSSYVIEGGGDGTTRDLTVTVRQVGAGLRISGLTAESLARGNCAIAYSLSAPAEVTARVLNMAGREVARISESRLQDAGAQTLNWNGRSAAGSSVASGLYIVELEAVSGSGERTRATAQVSLGL